MSDDNCCIKFCLHGAPLDLDLCCSPQEDCKTQLCSMAKTGTWQSMFSKKAIDKPWPRYVASPGTWGWERAAEEKCTLHHAGYRFIDPKKLFDDLVEGEHFNKKVCGCKTKDECS
ncbi:unnamed protein product [Symbiodinium pilosum]|uniref:Uncharacterized protein n=1 Tax=Symbiodinium pilosum TaxID=2952 RepID=A0A812S8F2_SYMPI|nr:unnamed protein product [Symbiodinium pilosum]